MRRGRKKTKRKVRRSRKKAKGPRRLKRVLKKGRRVRRARQKTQTSLLQSPLTWMGLPGGLCLSRYPKAVTPVSAGPRARHCSWDFLSREQSTNLSCSKTPKAALIVTTLRRRSTSFSSRASISLSFRAIVRRLFIVRTIACEY